MSHKESDDDLYDSPDTFPIPLTHDQVVFLQIVMAGLTGNPKSELKMKALCVHPQSRTEARELSRIFDDQHMLMHQVVISKTQLPVRMARDGIQS